MARLHRWPGTDGDGTAEILGVPGDQQAALRGEVRAAVRKRTGHGIDVQVPGQLGAVAVASVAARCRPMARSSGARPPVTVPVSRSASTGLSATTA